MVMRYPIEKWNRGELEDKFHELAEQNAAIKKHNNELERKLKILNGQKVNACQAGQFSKDGGLTQTELSKLRRENHVLGQKLKVLRTQLINYSRTTPSQAISQSTSQASLISNVFSKRVPSSINNAVREFDRSESTENNKVVIRKEKVSDEHMNQMLSINPLNSDNKTDMIKIYRRSQEMELELKETVFKFQKSEEKVVQLRREYDKVVCELELSHRNLQAVERRLAESISSSESFVRYTADDSSLSEKGLEIAEKEIAILREENNVLKAANDKLINSSFDEEKAPSKTLVDEVNALKSHVETIQQNFVSQRELRKNAEFRLSLLQSELSKLEKKNHRLSDELRLCMQNARQQQWRTNDYCDLNNNNKFSEADRQSNFMVNEQTASVSSTVYKSPAYPKDVLDRLFDDVIGILNTHMRRGENDCLANESILMKNDNQKPSFNERWQKMYEEIYSELEKVRIMLVTQYDINEKMKEEIVSLQNKADFIKRKCDTKLRDSAVLLEDREKRIQILENQLRSISQNDNRITEAFEPLTQMHSVDIAYNKCGLNGALNITELTMRFSKLVLTEAGLQLAKSMKPVLFLSVEFFDFELQTTPLLQGPEAIFDYSTVYEVMVSNLFIHYLDTDGVTLELFETHGLSYEQWSVERISLKKLLLLPSKASNHLAGQVKFTMKPASADGENKLKKPVTVALLDYTVDVPFSLISALNDQKKRMTASFYLTNNAEERSADMLCNHLYVNIYQCHGIKKLLKDPQKSCFFMAAYQLYDLPVHFSSTVFSDDGSPQFNDTRAWTFQMMNNSLHDYLRTQVCFMQSKLI